MVKKRHFSELVYTSVSVTGLSFDFCRSSLNVGSMRSVITVSVERNVAVYGWNEILSWLPRKPEKSNGGTSLFKAASSSRVYFFLILVGVRGSDLKSLYSTLPSARNLAELFTVNKVVLLSSSSLSVTTILRGFFTRFFILFFSVPEEVPSVLMVRDLSVGTSSKESAVSEWYSPAKPTPRGVVKGGGRMGWVAMAGISTREMI